MSFTQISTWFFTTFTAPEIKTKICHLQGTDYLYAKMNTDQLDLPQWIFEYDVKVRFHADTFDTYLMYKVF